METRKYTIRSEQQEQIALVTWMKIKKIKFYAIPNGGFRNLVEAVKLKRMGTISGVPDICIPIPRSPYHGAYIELKRERSGRLTKEQEEWIDYLTSVGYYVKVAHGFDNAKELISHYLGFDNA